MNKREHGAGSWRWQNESKGVIRVEVLANGQRRSATLKGIKNPKAAKDALRAWIVDLGKDTPVANEPRSFNQVADEWHKRRVLKMQQGGLTDATVAAEEWALKHLRKHLGTRILPIHQGVLADMLLELGSHLAPKSVKNCSSVLYAILQFAVDRDYCAVNTLTKVRAKDRPQERRTKPKTPPDDVMMQWLDTAKVHDVRLYTALIVFNQAGDRRGEELGLRLCDVDLETGVLQFLLNVTQKRRKREPGDTSPRVTWREAMKTPAGDDRKVTVGAATIDALRLHIETLHAKAREYGLDAYPPDGFLFSSDPLGAKPWYPDSINKRMKRLETRHKLAHVTPHQFRHWSATHLKPFLTAADMRSRFGWKTDRMIELYGDNRAAQDQKAAQILDGLVTKPRKLRAV